MAPHQSVKLAPVREPRTANSSLVRGTTPRFVHASLVRIQDPPPTLPRAGMICRFTEDRFLTFLSRKHTPRTLPSLLLTGKEPLSTYTHLGSTPKTGARGAQPHSAYTQVAQLEERWSETPEVTGSIPVTSFCAAPSSISNSRPAGAHANVAERQTH